ncbi:MAG: ThiF family adenylyltransferase [Planctomycetaceae bacterium]|nr:ThiF family adenylyltransferase [Planctomycetaceae bacterium]
MNASSDRFQRQESLAPRERLAELDVTVIGVGAIGRQLALQLASLGVTKLRLVDFDKVEPTNVTTQGYHFEDVGRAKVDAAASAVWQIDPQIHVETVNDRYRPQLEVGDALFCCVDSIETRAALWRTAGRRVSFWCDGRMLGEVMRILTVAEHLGRNHYPTTLFAASEVQPGSCTSRGIIYTACIAAGLMTHQLTRWLRGLPLDADLSLNLLASELAVAADPPPE